MEAFIDMTPSPEKFCRMRFGMDDGVIRSRKAVAEAFGITLDHARIVEFKILRKAFGHRVTASWLQEQFGSGLFPRG